MDFGKLNFSVAFNPTSAFPLDARSYFESLTEAQAAAASAGEVGSTSTVYHYGQKLLVKEGNAYKWYEIGADKALKATGIYMRSSGGYIQFSTNNTDWSNVIAVSALKGDKGDKGDKGATGEAGADGKDGLSAYEIAKNHGFEGTEAEWLEFLKGEDGKDGADGVGGGGSGECNLPDIAPKPETELISTTEGGFTYDTSYPWHSYISTTILNLAIGDKCKIVWDSDEYYCTVIDASTLMSGFKAMGNLSGFGLSGNNEPFIIGFNDSATTVVAVEDTEPATHSFAIYKVGVSPDEEKFLQVIDGKAAWVTIELAEDGGF